MKCRVQFWKNISRVIGLFDYKHDDDDRPELRPLEELPNSTFATTTCNLLKEGQKLRLVHTGRSYKQHHPTFVFLMLYKSTNVSV